MRVLSAVAFTLLATTNASAWVPAECPGKPPESWSVFEREMRTAIPSSMIYVPRPFPMKAADVIEDLRFQYFRIWKSTRRSDVPQEELPLLEGLEKGTLRFRVEKVVNWTPSRCLPDRPSQYYYLVRIFAQSGDEISRYVLSKTGLWVVLEHAPEDPDLKNRWKQGMPTLSAALAEVRLRYGLQGASAQYVRTSAGTVRCDPVQPCIAFQAGGSMYLFDQAPQGGLYEFTAASPGKSFEEMKAQRKAGPWKAVAGVDARVMGLLSVGNRWVYARKLAPGEKGR
jgi:hypothetical protein